MPMQTFFNLPEDKRKTILRAAKQEFSRVPFEEASISNIIKTAKIPRGSFYQYFYNKEDLFVFMVKNVGDKTTQKMEEFLKETHGDLIEAFVMLFDFLKAVLSKEENISFFKNIFLNMNEKTRECLSPTMSKEHAGFYEHFKAMIDFTKFTIEDEKEFIYLFRMLKGILFQNISSYFNGRLPVEEVDAAFSFQINLIKKAAYKNE